MDCLTWSATLNRLTSIGLFSGCPHHSVTTPCPNIIEKSILQVRGILWDSVERRSPSPMRSLGQHKNILDSRRQQSTIQSIFDSRCRDKYKDSQQAYCRVLSGVIVSNREGYDRRFRPGDCKGYNAWLNDLGSYYSGTSSILSMSSEESASFHRASQTACAGRHLFATEKGYAGTGPPELEVGDLIYALVGGNVLYVLRPVPSAPRPNTFHLIGDCYALGAMDGHAAWMGRRYRRSRA